MSENEQMRFSFFPLLEKEAEELIKERVMTMPKKDRVADARVMLQQIIRPQDLVFIGKSVDDAKTILEMYGLKAKDLLISKGEKKKIVELVEKVIGSIEFWTFKARHHNWKETEFKSDLELMILDGKELAMVDNNAIIKKKMVAELIRLVEEGMDIKTVTPEKIAKIYTQLWRRPSPMQILRTKA